jgi:transposase-like protein
MNAKDPQVIERFIELRAQGWSFARIAAELDVSKPTLINWSRQHQHRIRNLQALELEAAAEQCKLSRRHCLESLADDERRLREELACRDLKDISTARLLLLVAALRKEANALNGPLRLSEPITTDVPLADQVPEVVVSWEG